MFPMKKSTTHFVPLFVVSCDGMCTICQGDICVRQEDYVGLSECGHCFHTDCLGAWACSGHPASHTCPVCRLSTDHQRLQTSIASVDRVRRKLDF